MKAFLNKIIREGKTNRVVNVGKGGRHNTSHQAAPPSSIPPFEPDRHPHPLTPSPEPFWFYIGRSLRTSGMVSTTQRESSVLSRPGQRFCPLLLFNV